MIEFLMVPALDRKIPANAAGLNENKPVLRAHAEHLFKALHRNAAPPLESPARLVTTT